MSTTVQQPPEAPESPAQDQPQRPSGLEAAAAAVADVRKRAFRYRDALVPHAVVAGTWTAGVVLHACDVPIWQVLAGEALAGGLLAGMFPSLREKLAGRVWWLGAGGWMAMASELGAGGPMLSLLAAGGGLLTIPRVFKYRVRINKPKMTRKELAAAQARKALEGPDPNVQVWNAKAARKGKGVLPGSTLSHREPFEYGVRYRITLDGQTTEDAMAARKQLCADFGKALDYLLVDETEDGLLNAAELTILDRLAVEDVQPWTEPMLDMETGILPLGPFADGRGDSAIQVWETGSGPLPTGIFGAMRVGKSSLIKLAAVEFQRAGNIQMIYMDPQRGQSAPAILPYVPEPALGLEQIRERLHQVRQEMNDRNQMLASIEWTDSAGRKQRGVQSFDRPGAHGLDMLIVAIDEAHRVLIYDDLAQIVHELMAEGSKCGIMPWILNQDALVDHVGGGEILSLINSGNLVVLRTGGAYTAQATFGQRLEAYPHMIKKTFQGTTKHTKGCGYVLGATSRSVMTRIRDVGDIGKAMGTLPPPQIRWMSQAPASPPQQPAAEQPTTAPPVHPAHPSDSEDDFDLNLDNVVDFVQLDPAQETEAEEKILRLLEGADHGLDAADLTHGTGLPLVTVFRVASGLVARGAIVQNDDRYLQARAAS